MEFDEKAAARNRYRSHQHLKRVHAGKSKSGGHHVHHSQHQDLSQSSFSRSYSSSENEDETEITGGTVRQSEGADLGQLLIESEQFYAQAHLRYRSFIGAIDTEAPPCDVAAFEKELAIEPDLLVQALAQLPLSEFLGIEQQFLIGHCQAQVSPGDAAGTQVQQQQQAAEQATQQVLKVVPSDQQQHQTQPSQSLSTNTPSDGSSSRLHAAPLAATSATRAVEQAADQDDDTLQELLSGSVTPTRTAASQAKGATADRDSSRRLHQSAAASSSVSNSSTQLQALQVAQLASSNAATALQSNKIIVSSTGNTAVKVEDSLQGEVVDDGLDELLGLSGTAANPRQASPPVTAGNAMAGAASGSTRSKKQSLEDWLDTF